MRTGAWSSFLCLALISCGTASRPPGEPIPTLPDGSCTAPLPLQPGIALAGTTQGRTKVLAASCGAGGLGPEVVHSIVLDRPSRILVELETKSHDGAVHVRSACGQEADVACNEDSGGPGRSLLWTHLVAGTWLVVADGSMPDDEGPYSLVVYVHEDGAKGPANDSCAGASTIVAGAAPYGDAAVSDTTFFARDDAWAPCSSSPGGPDVFYRMDLASEALVTVAATLSDFQFPVVAVAGGCAGDWSACGLGSVTARMPAGSMTILVDSLGADLLGGFELSVTLSNPG